MCPAGSANINMLTTPRFLILSRTFASSPVISILSFSPVLFWVISRYPFLTLSQRNFLTICRCFDQSDRQYPGHRVIHLSSVYKRVPVLSLDTYIFLFFVHFHLTCQSCNRVDYCHVSSCNRPVAEDRKKFDFFFCTGFG